MHQINGLKLLVCLEFFYFCTYIILAITKANDVNIYKPTWTHMSNTRANKLKSIMIS